MLFSLAEAMPSKQYNSWMVLQFCCTYNIKWYDAGLTLDGSPMEVILAGEVKIAMNLHSFIP